MPGTSSGSRKNLGNGWALRCGACGCEGRRSTVEPDVLPVLTITFIRGEAALLCPACRTTRYAGSASPPGARRRSGSA